ncbi:MAG: hypothetical protein H2069_02735 [Legionella sp.]|nr:hypothetical protein [Legionella sp.]
MPKPTHQAILELTKENPDLLESLACVAHLLREKNVNYTVFSQRLNDLNATTEAAGITVQKMLQLPIKILRTQTDRKKLLSVAAEKIIDPVKKTEEAKNVAIGKTLTDSPLDEEKNRVKKINDDLKSYNEQLNNSKLPRHRHKIEDKQQIEKYEEDLLNIIKTHPQTVSEYQQYKKLVENEELLIASYRQAANDYPTHCEQFEQASDRIRSFERGANRLFIDSTTKNRLNILKQHGMLIIQPDNKLKVPQKKYNEIDYSFHPELNLFDQDVQEAVINAAKEFKKDQPVNHVLGLTLEQNQQPKTKEVKKESLMPTEGSEKTQQVTTVLEPNLDYPQQPETEEVKEEEALMPTEGSEKTQQVTAVLEPNLDYPQQPETEEVQEETLMPTECSEKTQQVTTVLESELKKTQQIETQDDDLLRQKLLSLYKEIVKKDLLQQIDQLIKNENHKIKTTEQSNEALIEASIPYVSSDTDWQELSKGNLLRTLSRNNKKCDSFKLNGKNKALEKLKNLSRAIHAIDQLQGKSSELSPLSCFDQLQLSFNEYKKAATTKRAYRIIQFFQSLYDRFFTTHGKMQRKIDTSFKKLRLFQPPNSVSKTTKNGSDSKQLMLIG